VQAFLSIHCAKATAKPVSAEQQAEIIPVNATTAQTAAERQNPASVEKPFVLTGQSMTTVLFDLPETSD